MYIDGTFHGHMLNRNFYYGFFSIKVAVNSFIYKNEDNAVVNALYFILHATHISLEYALKVFNTNL